MNFFNNLYKYICNSDQILDKDSNINLKLKIGLLITGVENKTDVVGTGNAGDTNIINLLNASLPEVGISNEQNIIFDKILELIEDGKNPKSYGYFISGELSAIRNMTLDNYFYYKIGDLLVLSGSGWSDDFTKFDFLYSTDGSTYNTEFYYDYFYEKIKVYDNSTDDGQTYNISPNSFYIFGEKESLNISLKSSDENFLQEYMFQFTSGSTPTTLTLPSSVKWLDEPTIEANMTYLVSIVNNIGLIVGVES